MMRVGAASSALRPRLLVLASTYPRWAGDPEPGFVHELARRLTANFEVTVLCPHASGAAVREKLDGVEVVRYRYAPARLEVLVNDGGIITNLGRRPWAWLLVPGFLLALVWATWRLIRRIRPGVIHAHWLIPQGLVVAGLGVLGLHVPPFLATSHGADLFALRGRLSANLKRFVLRRAAATTVVSESMCEAVVHLGADPSRVRVEPMGVDLGERFNPDLAVPRSRTELLFVGRLVEKKGLRHLLDAMPLILAQRPEVILTVAGFGPEEAERRAQAKRLGVVDRITFLGAVPQTALPALYRRAAVFVAPFVQAASGDQEGLGLVLVEALGCGCPTIVSDLPATRELKDGAGLVRIPPENPERLAQAVLDVLVKGPRLAEVDLERFGWAQRADAYSALLSALPDVGEA